MITRKTIVLTRWTSVGKVKTKTFYYKKKFVSCMVVMRIPLVLELFLQEKNVELPIVLEENETWMKGI